jgi:hypothetical protein
LDSKKIEGTMLRAVEGWPHDGLDVVVRYSRGAEFSGTCFYTKKRITVNLGRDNTYPYAVRTDISRAQSNSRYWWRELYLVEVADARQLVLFVFLHEFYHWLVKKAGRNVRQKEARCDRFAARTLVDDYGAVVNDSAGGAVSRGSWDFQDLEGFVAAARHVGGRGRRRKGVGPSEVAVAPARPAALGGQLLLFDLRGERRL